MAEDIREYDHEETEELFSKLTKANKKPEEKDERQKVREIEDLTRNIWAGDGLRKEKKK